MSWPVAVVIVGVAFASMALYLGLALVTGLVKLGEKEIEKQKGLDREALESVPRIRDDLRQLTNDHTDTRAQVDSLLARRR